MRCSPPHPEPGALAALIGATRATVLEEICGSPTTTTIARRLGISAGNASQHTTVLRQAGLITSHRERNRVLHHATALGMALLDNDSQRVGQPDIDAATLIGTATADV
ncbi:DNA-binding transcriptional ArsR family regulator [Kibdelosporangium banguiense]|uniref:DNA-binding transcriptional ArsR family regulator n=1 Tax=Kibdelosporangium banguiense TaxID=1365924 RepID=A0ABS4TY59_9PSEU|nr:winged helix-turn-helix domain-containing protein [Kibdelosporangium banguiense]MBP2329324.1 DNA-binding transcriptional ArsR family regulator [Kibdelosporangium banguiense]